MSTIFDQAIFTSVRTPMGEGYRVIAASQGVKPDEKQAITRNSPSHKGLCLEHADLEEDQEIVPGLAYYRMPSGRLCLAISNFAGAEHTARGGQRIYTHNLLFSDSDLASWEFNPLHITRAAITAGAVEPQLKPEKILPTVELNFECADAPPCMPATFEASTRRLVLNNMLLGKNTVLNLGDRWIDALECLMLGLPGPRRGDVSFSSGLQFSVSRTHQLTILNDAKGYAKKRSVGQPVSYLESGEENTGPLDAPATWLSFVAEHWRRDDTRGLARRTNRNFANCEPEALFTLGDAFNMQVAAPSASMGELVDMIEKCRHAGYLSHAMDIADQTRAAVGAALENLVQSASWNQVCCFFPNLSKWWSEDDTSATLAAPVLCGMLDAAAREDVWVASDHLTELMTANVRPVVQGYWDRMLDQTITAMARWCNNAEEKDATKLQRFVSTWTPHRPNSPAMKVIQERCETLSGATHEAG